MEMLVAVAAGGVILSLVSVLLIESGRTWRREERSFSARQSGDRFVRDFRRDLRRSLPGGAAYGEEAFIIEFAGEFIGNEMDYAEPGRYTARYYISGDRDRPAAVRELYLNGAPAAERVYEDVVYFSLDESELYSSLFNLEVQIAGGEPPIRVSIHAPAQGAER